MASRSLRLTLLPALLTLLLPATGSAADFDCYEPFDHCLAQERDNVTFYLDTDGSMNADSGRNVDGSPGNETYWEAALLTLDEIVRDNHNNGNCNKCDDKDCDGIRVGIGYYGDNSLDDANDGINAYRAVSAGENRRDDVLDSMNDEEAGIGGLPGIETLECPPDGTGQRDVITCPDNGTAQIEHIECPSDGVQQVDQIVCPPDGRAQKTTVAVITAPGFVTKLYTLTVNTTTVTYLAAPFEPVATVALQLRNLLDFQSALDAFSFTRSANVITVDGPDSLTSFSVGAGSDYFTNTTTNLPGLPDDPSGTDTYTFSINGDPHPVAAASTSAGVCDNVVAAIAASAQPVVYERISPNTVHIKAEVPGAGFTYNQPVDSDLAHSSVDANVSGLPGDPAVGTTYSFTINSSTISVNGAADSDSDSICNALRAAIVSSGEPVTLQTSAGSGGRTAFDIRAAVSGQAFTFNVPGGSELAHNTVQNNVAGFPGSPAPGHVYNFDFNNSTLSVDSTGMTSNTQLCAAIESALDATGIVEATASGNTVEVVAVEQGVTWTIDNEDSALTVASDIGPGLPRDPGSNHAYHLEINTNDVDWTDDGSPTQEEVCIALTSRINTAGAGVLTATHDGSTITMVGTSAADFDVTNYDSSLMHNVERVAGLGPVAYGALGQRILDDLDSTSRRQNAIVITARAPEQYADLNESIAALCTKRDDEDSPGTTHFIGLDMSDDEKDLMNVLAAAGGSGTCSVDPCVGTAVTPTLQLAPGVTCGGAKFGHAGNIKSRINEISGKLSCTLRLDVPPSYSDGQAPDDPWSVFVEIRKWNLDGLGHEDPQVFHYNQCGWFGWWWQCPYRRYDRVLEDWYGADDDAAEDFDDQGWEFVPGDRSQITFTDALCDEIRDGNITQIRTEVGCQCANQGEECTDTTTTFTCKSPTDGSPQPCTAEQLANMRCATGVYLCDNGVEVCSAGGTNSMPEICNGIDDDCDGIVDNMSNSSEMEFDGRDPEGVNCGFRDLCVCPDGWQDTPSAGTDIDDHLASWSGNCTCGEGLDDAEPNFTASNDEPASSASGDPQVACATGMGIGDDSLVALALLGIFGLRRRRR